MGFNAYVGRTSFRYVGRTGVRYVGRTVGGIGGRCIALVRGTYRFDFWRPGLLAFAGTGSFGGAVAVALLAFRQATLQR